MKSRTPKTCPREEIKQSPVDATTKNTYVEMSMATGTSQKVPKACREPAMNKALIPAPMPISIKRPKRPTKIRYTLPPDTTRSYADLITGIIRALLKPAIPYLFADKRDNKR